MKNKLFNYFLIASLAAMSLVACVKKEVTPLRNEGEQFLKIQEAPEAKVFSEPYTGVKPVTLFSLIRSSANETQAAKATSFKITSGTQADVDAYNTENDTEYELLPDSLYTMATGITKSGSTYTVPFASGNFAKEFTINLNGSKWDLSKKYAMKYTITDSAGVNINEGNKEIMVFIAIANRWDGIYEVTDGTFTDVGNAALRHVNLDLAQYGIKQVFHLETISATECIVYDATVFEDYICPFGTSGGLSGFGSFAAIFEFDLATNKLIKVTNAYGQDYGSNKRGGRLDPTGVNTWSAGTLKAKYNMTQKANYAAAVAPNYVRATWDETWKRKSSR
jgi:hypothetical protein